MNAALKKAANASLTIKELSSLKTGHLMPADISASGI
jgi:hypothetical protein